MTVSSRLDSKLEIVTSNSFFDRNRAAIFISIFTTIASFVFLCAYRPHANELNLLVKWPVPIANGNVVCHWDTGDGFNQREWRHDPLIPYGTGHAFAMTLPSQTIRQLRLRTSYAGETIPIPEMRTVNRSGDEKSRAFSMTPPRNLKEARRFHAATFNGTSSYIQYAEQLRTDPSQPFSVSLWFRRSSRHCGMQELLGNWTPQTQANAFFLGWTPDGSWRISPHANKIQVGTIEPNHWYHVTVTHTTQRTRIYLNAAFVAEINNLQFDTSGPFVTGRQGALDGEYFSGSMGPIHIHHIELNESDVEEQFFASSNANGAQCIETASDATSRVGDGNKHDVIMDKTTAIPELPRVVDFICEFDKSVQATRLDLFQLIAQSTLALLIGLLIGLIVSSNLAGHWQARQLVRPLSWSKPVRSFAIYFLIVSLPSFLFFAIYFPGIFNNDAIECWSIATTGIMDDVHPAIYHLHTKILKLIWNSHEVMTVFQIVVMSSVLAGMLAYARTCGVNKYITACVALGLGFAPGIFVYNCYPQKDVLSTALCLIWAFAIFHLHRRKMIVGIVKYSVLKIVVAGVLLALLVTIRYNNIINIVAIPAILFVFRLLPGRTLLSFTIVSAVAFVAFQLLLPRVLGVSRTSPNYFQGMAMTNPLAALVKYPGDDCQLTPEEITKLQEIFGLSIAEIQSLYQPLDANHLFFHDRNRIGKLESPEEKRWLMNFYIRRLGIRYPHVFMGDRTTMFTNAVWAPFYTFFDIDTQQHTIRSAVGVTGYSFHSRSLLPEQKHRLVRLVESSEKRKHVWWNSSFGLFCLVGALLLNRWLPSSAIFAIVVLVQVPLLFAAMPMAYFKYVHFLYPMAVIIPLMIAIEIKTRHKPAVN